VVKNREIISTESLNCGRCLW